MRIHSFAILLSLLAVIATGVALFYLGEITFPAVVAALLFALVVLPWPSISTGLKCGNSS